MILGFYGYSNSGKTTLIEKICGELKKENLRIAVIKHIPYENFSIDNKTKDTGRFKNLGVDVAAFSPNETAFILGGMNFTDIISKLESIRNYDVILVEGLKKENIPKIRVGDCPIEDETIMSVTGKDEEIEKITEWIKDRIDKDKKQDVIVKVSGKRLNMGNFPKKIIKEVVVAMVSSLKGGEEAEEIEIIIKNIKNSQKDED